MAHVLRIYTRGQSCVSKVPCISSILYSVVTASNGKSSDREILFLYTPSLSSHLIFRPSFFVSLKSICSKVILYNSFAGSLSSPSTFQKRNYYIANHISSLYRLYLHEIVSYVTQNSPSTFLFDSSTSMASSPLPPSPFVSLSSPSAR